MVSPMRYLGVVALLAVLQCVGALAAQQAVGAQRVDSSLAEALANGNEAVKLAHYDEAVRHFRAAVMLDPSSTEAEMDLGRAYAAEVIPNLTTPENQAMVQNAERVLRAIPEGALEYLEAQRALAAVLLDAKLLEEARAVDGNVLRLEPLDAGARYRIGVIDWREAYKNAVSLLGRYELQDDGVGNSKLNVLACSQLRAANEALVDDGIEKLEQAVALRPSFDDAMQYLNLLYRRRADLACGVEAERAEAVSQAEMWLAKEREARRKNEAEREKQMQATPETGSPGGAGRTLSPPSVPQL